MPGLDNLASTAAGTSEVVSLFLALAILLAAAKLAGEFFVRLGQPAVVGELLAGLLLGPTLIDLLSRPFAGGSFSAETIHVLAQLGVLWLMFGAGLEVEFEDYRRAGRPAGLAALLGVVLPVLGGVGLALAFGYPSGQAWFIGLILSATSVTISAQTLLELGKLRTPVGTALMGAAVIDDVLVIIMLSVFLGVVGGGASLASVAAQIGVMALTLAGVAAAAWLVLPRVAQAGSRLRVSQGTTSLVLAGVLLLAWATEHLGGMAAITGAFLAGVGLGRSHLRDEIERGLATLSFAFFVPLFLVDIGLQADLGALDSRGLGFGLALLLVAGLTKLVGAALGARLGGMPPRPSIQLGLGMMSRGEVGLIVAGVGTAGGLLSGEVFGAVILMVIGTTLATPVLLRRAFRPEEG